jgi:hypothetical protein
VTLALEGFGTYTEELRVVTGATVERNVVLKVGALAESITVSGESPMVDTRTAAVASTTTREVIENLPIIRTTVTDYVQATPGVSASSPGAYNEQIQVMGSPSNETTYVHDGVVINHVRTGNTWQGSDIDSVEEINTVALGASAEWQSTAGGVVNVVTKSGTNKYEGDYGRSLTIFPILNSPSARVFLRTNRLDYSDKYNGLVASVVKRLSHRWQGQANLTLGKSQGLRLTGNAGRDPNDVTNATGRLNPTDRPVMQCVVRPAQNRRPRLRELSEPFECSVRAGRVCGAATGPPEHQHRRARCVSSRTDLAPVSAIQQDRPAAGRTEARVHRQPRERPAERGADRHRYGQLHYVQLFQPELWPAQHLGAAAHAVRRHSCKLLERFR